MKPVRVTHHDPMFDAIAKHLGGVALANYSAALAGSDGEGTVKHWWANGTQSKEEAEMLRTGERAGAYVAVAQRAKL